MRIRLRRTILVVLACACLVPLLVCAGFLYLRQPREGLKGRLYQVRAGMTRDEVEAIMGRTPDAVHDALNPGVVLSWEGWDGPYYRAEVYLDGEHGRVTFRRVFYLNHQQTLADRWAPLWVHRTSPPPWLDGWWPQ